jgi:ATP-dependent Clp protease ATP-binding subunit ClpX
MEKRNRNASCSFCRKNYRDVGPLVEGPGEVYICGECIELCQSIIDQERRRRRGAEAGSGASKDQTILKRFAQLVPEQDEAREALILAALRHFQSTGPAEPQPILLVGPTRSSRLLLARALAHAFEAPFAEADAYMPPGAKNPPMDFLLQRLLLACKFDREAAQRGVFYVDGLDERATQDWLLRVWEQGVSITMAQPFRCEVGHLLFLCGGRFAGLDDTVARLGQHPEQPLTGEALLAFGMATEFVKRLAGIVKVAPLDEETLAHMVPWVDFDRMARRDGDRTGS